MICQQCMERPAKVQISQTINNQKTVMYLCEECASARKDLALNLPFNVGNMLAGILGNFHGIAQIPVQDKIEVCSQCGMVFDEFIKTGKFGCANCYETFRLKLVPIFRRIHGSTKHTGKASSGISEQRKTVNEITELRALLEEMIKNEKYEKAAEIRDKIKELELQKKGGS